MASNFFNIIALFLSLMIVGTIIASPVDPKKSFGYFLMNVALESMNNNSPNNHTYRSGTLLKAKKIKTDNNIPILNVSVRLDPDCTGESLCLQEICNMLIKQDESNNIIVDDQSKECRYDKSKPNSNHLDGRFKREINSHKIDDNEKWMKVLASRAGAEWINYCRKSNTNCLWSHHDHNEVKIINATSISGFFVPKYQIYFNLTKATCVETKPLQHNCWYDDSSTVLCNVNITDSWNFVRNIYLNTICDDKGPVLSSWY
ncbi:uncharacterized protein [Chelonus insularis]|uniref:uncharacterized protein n=1 Tax=Chelonus insularis TaxID=460826 RepID=UPI00158F4946|nr:uncharacterized protein LOC118067393 [Chelonus insularis]